MAKSMQTWIALFRGINVGGKNILPMAELRQILESLGLENVRTYIQSGNVLFDSRARLASPLGKKISRCIEAQKGFRPEILLLTPKGLQDAVKSNPFAKAVSDPQTLHFLFLAEPASNFDSEAVEAVKSQSEEFRLTEKVFYLHAPDGIGRSRLAAKVEKLLGIRATGRNFRTVEKILAMVSDS